MTSKAKSIFWFIGFTCWVLGFVAGILIINSRVADEARATDYYYHLSQCIGVQYEHACVTSIVHSTEGYGR